MWWKKKISYKNSDGLSFVQLKVTIKIVFVGWTCCIMFISDKRFVHMIVKSEYIFLLKIGRFKPPVETGDFICNKFKNLTFYLTYSPYSLIK